MSAQPAGSTTATTPPPSDNLVSTSSSHKRSATIGTGVAIAIAIVLLIVGIAGGYFIGTALNKSSSASTIDLTETGSSLLYPLFNNYWFPNYTAPNVVLSADSSGSGQGQTSAELGLVNIGASDAYLANASATNLVNFPVAISAQLIYYNLPTVTAGPIDFNGTILGMIYAGLITTWDNPLILSAQSPAVAAQLLTLSSETIFVVARSDSSGDTYLFTSYCYLSWAGFPYTPSTASMSLTAGPTGGVPKADQIFGSKNSGMVDGISGQVGAVGYVGISYESLAKTAGLQYGALGNNVTVGNGNFTLNSADYVLPTTTTISNDANLGLTHLDFASYGLAVTLILGGVPGTLTPTTAGLGGSNPLAGQPAYPLVNLEYALIKTAPQGNVVTGAALAATVAFMHWAISYGNYGATGGASAWIGAVNFVPLTPEVVGYDNVEIAGIQNTS
jgi:phosphate transport system substrate-binding protein